jgi:hypothetical protein
MQLPLISAYPKRLKIPAHAAFHASFEARSAWRSICALTIKPSGYKQPRKKINSR